jgi:hypothetical protein
MSFSRGRAIAGCAVMTSAAPPSLTAWPAVACVRSGCPHLAAVNVTPTVFGPAVDHAGAAPARNASCHNGAPTPCDHRHAC